MSRSSASDYETSDGSNSPASTSSRDSPYASPSQQIPQLTLELNTLSCVEKNLLYSGRNDAAPFLRIIEQPQSHFRFRYVSEMVGTHGCLLAKSCDSKNKKHPTVELVNYGGRAIIRCRLAQFNNNEEHPHKLLENEQDKDVCCTVPENGSYKVGFPGMGIIHTAKKDVVNLLFKKHLQIQRTPVNEKELRARCERQAKEINLNIVRLMFTAHDSDTGSQICPPVFSENINNMKSAATNDLKICRVCPYRGLPQGGEDILMFVEKVNKKNIMIRFFEMDDSNNVVWTSNANFIQSDVHHQYGIAFRTPPYKDPKTPVDVKVYMELVRPTDGRTSEPVPFTYKADAVHKQMHLAKKRKMNSYSSLSSDGSLTDELPVTVLNTEADLKVDVAMPMHKFEIPMSSSPVECGLGIALNTDMAPMCPPAPVLYDLKFDSAELDRIVADNDAPIVISDSLLNHYAESFSSLSDLPMDMTGMNFIRMSTSNDVTLVADSGRVKIEPSASPPLTQQTSQQKEVNDKNNEYPGVYKKEDATEVKELVKELCEIIRTKKVSNSEDVKTKLERLFEIRLSNGDTFLHMTLCSNQASFETIVRVIHGAGMSHLLNYTNNKQQTILHLAVVHGSPEIIALLIAKGCDPMQKDSQEENAIHYAIRYNNKLLQPLLDAAELHKLHLDLDDTNYEKQTALHLCVQYNAVDCAARLLRGGASLSARDERARTPVHLAAYDARSELLALMLDYVPASDIDTPDGYGHTALQIVCGTPHTSLETVKLLLEKKADPLKQEDNSESAFKLCRDKSSVRDLLCQYIGQQPIDEDIKSEPEDDYESAEEDVEVSGLSELSLYARAVATKIDAADAWRLLAERLNVSEMMSWLETQPSPAYKLLYHIKECREEVTSKSLALILEDMGLSDAATIIRSFIE